MSQLTFFIEKKLVATTLVGIMHPVSCIIFYRAACNADAILWWEFCPSVCPSVCPCVRHTREL